MMGTTTDHQLAIDIGNTSVKAGVFLNGELIGPVSRFTDQEWDVADRMVTNLGVKNIIFSTVANEPPAKWMDKWNKAGLCTLALSPDLPLPFASLYETPATLGQDRIAAVAGSLALPTSPVPTESRAAAPPEHPPARLIVDAGTCITFDLIDGGDASLLADLLTIPTVIYPNLVLRGLNQILSYYVQHQS